MPAEFRQNRRWWVTLGAATSAALSDGGLLDWDRHVDAILAAYGSVRAGRAAPAEPTGTAE